MAWRSVEAWLPMLRATDALYFVPSRHCASPHYSAACREARIKRHATIDTQRGAGDVIGAVRDQPGNRLRDVIGFTDALVRHERHEVAVGLRAFPGRPVDWRPD